MTLPLLQTQRDAVFFQAKQNGEWIMSEQYPVSDFFRAVDGFDVYRSSKLIVAFVVVESDYGKQLRLYRWQNRNGSWKVDLCRMSVDRWNWSEISAKISSLCAKYSIGGITP